MTKNSLIAAIRTFEFFPTVAALVDFLADRQSTASCCPKGQAIAAPYQMKTTDAWWQTHDVKTCAEDELVEHLKALDTWRQVVK